MKKITRKHFLEQCIICHKKSYYVSRNGLCPSCVVEKVELARVEIRCKEGAIYEKWKANIIRSLNKFPTIKSDAPNANL
jgi:hypothetical protein